MNIEVTTRMTPTSMRHGRARLMTALGAGTALGASVLYILDPVSGRRRRSIARDRVAGTVRRTWRNAARSVRGVRATGYGMSQRVQHLREQDKDLDDVTLAHKIETELFRDPDVPKGQINVNVHGGLVQLRGEVPSLDMLSDLVARTRRIQGVQEIENLLHLPGKPAPMHQ
jgi:osmotically-inducible protein OsmY